MTDGWRAPFRARGGAEVSQGNGGVEWWVAWETEGRSGRRSWGQRAEAEAGESAESTPYYVRAAVVTD